MIPGALMTADRAFLLHYAKVLLREAKARRGQNVQWMINGSARARREAFAMRPAQADLFAQSLANLPNHHADQNSLHPGGVQSVGELS